MKIAIVGTAPNFVEAPFKDPEWEIWGIPGIYPQAPRIDKLYELHKYRDIKEFIEPKEGFISFAQKMGPNFITQERVDNYPDATLFEFQKYLDKYGPYFASSISWMLAEAIEKEPEEIGLFGVNMSHSSEYEFQRPSACYFIGIATAKGIKVVLPKTSELMMVPVQYGFEDEPQICHMMREKKKQAEENIKIAEENAKRFDGDKRYFEGVKDTMTEFEKNWIR